VPGARLLEQLLAPLGVVPGSWEFRTQVAGRLQRWPEGPQQGGRKRLEEGLAETKAPLEGPEERQSKAMAPKETLEEEQPEAGAPKEELERRMARMWVPAGRQGELVGRVAEAQGG